MKHLHFSLAVIIVLLNGCQSQPPKVERTTGQPTAPPQAQQIATTNAPASEPANLPKQLALFDGKTLTGWKVTDFGGHGEVEVKQGAIECSMGADLSGVAWTNTAVLPHSNYEIELDAMKVDGNDFFCGLTFPVGNSFCSLILGGWGGGIVGLSSIDGMDASENETSKNRYFDRNRWFHVRLRVTPEKIMAWVDNDNIVDVEITGRKIAVRAGGIDMCTPLGLSTWQTTAAWKNIKLQRL